MPYLERYASTGRPAPKGVFISVGMEIKKGFSHINEYARKSFDISRDDYALCDYLHYRSADPRMKMPGWCTDPKDEIADFVGITRQGLYKVLDRLSRLGLIEMSPSTGFSRATPLFIDAHCKQSLQPTVNKVYTDCKQSLHTTVNKVYTHIKEENKESKIENKEDKGFSSAKAEGYAQSPESENFASEPIPYAKQNTPPAPPPPVAVTIHDEIETLSGPVTVEISERVQIAADAENSTPNERLPQTAPTSKAEREDALVSEIIDYLNERAKKGYKTTTKENRSGILARHKEGATVEEMKAVIDDRVKEWGREVKSREWLNPVCLFRPGNFERYKETVADKKRIEAEKAKQQQPTVSPKPAAQPAYRDQAQGMRRF